MGWFVKLHPDVDIFRLHKFFLVRVKRTVKDPDFALVVKVIFSSAKVNTPIQAWSFVKCSKQRSKAVHIEVRAY